MRFRNFIFIFVAALAPQGVGLRAELPPLIPRAVLFGNPDKAHPRISPDGRKLAYLAPDKGVLNVWVRTLGEDDDQPITQDLNRGIQAYFWAPSGKHILYIQDKDGDENWHLHRVDLKTRVSKNLTPFPGVQVRVIAVQPQHLDRILISMNTRDPQLHDVFLLNVNTGALTLHVENTDQWVAWTADHDLQIRAALKLTPDGGTELVVRRTVEAPWRTRMVWSPVDVLESGPVRFTPDGRSLYIISSKGTDCGQLRELGIEHDREELLASERSSDVAGLLIHPVRHTVQAVAFNKERIHWRILDRSLKRDFHAIRRLRRGDFRVLNRDRADRRWLLAFTTDDGPIYYYVYDRESRHGKQLFSNRQALEGVRLAKMVPISFRARDGLPIRGYLTIPPGLRAKRLPLVVSVHGGPWSGRVSWGYNGVTQWLANRGYAVLQVNYRGSVGYGKQFLNAANREWGGRMQDDLIDGVRWAVEKGIVDPDRVAIMGGGYGGYAALVGLTKTPDFFCCAVAMYGMANLVTYMENIPSYLKPLEPLLWDRIGHPVKDKEFLMSRSPLFQIDRIKRPLLMGHGANDPRVPKVQAMRFVNAMLEAGKSIEFVEYPDEGRGFTRPANRLDFFARAEGFLARHLGGRFEP